MNDEPLFVPQELLARASRLLPKLQETPWGDAVRWNDTALVRLALSRGLDVLEDELATAEERMFGGMKKPPTPAANPKKKKG